ncbi:ferritin-like domain-containing protein [Roseomonas stagni]|uniref:Ferritin-like domain-containing protein n=1 Tax=Falsiroseomonas algicola TaxID=2716930 RepID=A0A6M1LK74_9PROT|nr:ferritin-like domain-containing protein [Falsiroseomonas algicola]NGM20713.1 ferritin-like domain-containing protein [Falsiroseomonas algicola]
MASSIRDIYITGLTNAHALEAQAIQLINRQVERIENYPEMRERLRLHGEESKRQQERLAQILDGLGTSPSGLKDLGTSLMGNMAAIGHALAPDEVIKNSFANFAFEHMEIASYRSLLTMAQAAGDTGAPRLLEQSLQEEIAMARWIEDNLEATTRRYMQRETAGQTSGI